MVTERFLDELEEKIEHLLIDSVFAVEYVGTIDEVALTEAFRLLCLRHPVLCGRIYSNDSGYILRLSASGLPDVDIVDDPDNRFIEEASRDFGRVAGKMGDNWDRGRPLSRLKVIRVKHGGYVLFSVRHSLVDGASLGALQRELWELYTDVVAGNEIVKDPGNALPRSPLNILRKSWGNVEFRPSGVDPVETSESCEASCWPLKLSEEDTSALVRCARERDVTVGALLLSESVMAMRDFEGVSNRSRIRISTRVNLRQHVHPTVGATETTYFAGDSVVTIDKPHLACVGLIGEEFRSKLETSIRNRQVLVPGYSKDSINVSADDADLIFNNVGRMPEITCPQGIEILNVISPRWSYGSRRIPYREKQVPFAVSSLYFNGKMTVIPSGRLELKVVSDMIEDRLRSIIQDEVSVAN